MAARDLCEVVFGGAITDTTPPTISAYTPASGSTIDADDTIAVDITDASGLQNVYARASWTGQTEHVWHKTSASNAFGARYTTHSTWETDTLTIRRTGNWPAATITIDLVAVDSDGNETIASTGTFTVTSPSTGPTIGSYVPGASTTLAANTTPIQFDITSPTGSLSSYVVTAGGETVWNGSAFVAPYAASSTNNAITDGRRLVLTRTGGWPNATLTLGIIATDTNGSATASPSWTVPNPTGAAPTLTGLSPANGTELGRTQAVTFNVVYAGVRRKTIVMASFPDGRYDVIYDGTAFAPLYDNGSTVTPTGETYAFSIVPDAYWRGAPTWSVVAIDTIGQEGS